MPQTDATTDEPSDEHDTPDELESDGGEAHHPETHFTTDYGSKEELLEQLSFTDGETVTELVEFKSSAWALIEAEADAQGVTAEELIRTHVLAGVAAPDIDDHAVLSTDVEIGADTWERIALRAATALQGSEKDPNDAFQDAVDEYVTVWPNLLVDGETKGLEDVPGVEADEESQAGSGDSRSEPHTSTGEDGDATDGGEQ